MQKRLPGCLLLLVFFHASAVTPVSAHGGLAGDEALRAILLEGIEANFSGDYDRAAETFAGARTLDPGHPAPDFYAATVLFWRNGLDPNNPRFDEEIQRHLALAAEKARVRVTEQGARVEALHYLGLAYTYLGRLEAQRGRFYAGGTHGETGRDYLEQALEECSRRGPGELPRACSDVAFPLGAYAYFAGRLPAFLQKLNFLWFLPRGTTQEGLAELEKAYRDSELHRLGAASLLARIYTVFEKGMGARALELSSFLAARFPDNPVLNLEHADLLLRLGRTGEASVLAAEVLDKVNRGLRGYDETTARAALLVQAEAAVAQGDAARAEGILSPLRADSHLQRNTLTPKIDLLQGMLEDLKGNRARALAFYEEAAGHKGRTANRQASKDAKRFMETPYRGGVSSSPP